MHQETLTNTGPTSLLSCTAAVETSRLSRQSQSRSYVLVSPSGSHNRRNRHKHKGKLCGDEGRKDRGGKEDGDARLANMLYTYCEVI